MNSGRPAGTDCHSDLQERRRQFLAVFKGFVQCGWAPFCDLTNFVSTSTYSIAPLERVLRRTADDSVGVERQHCGVLGKQANCQVLRSLTLARMEVPMPIALRMYLPEDWAQDKARRAATKVTKSIIFEPKGGIALAQIDASGLRCALWNGTGRRRLWRLGRLSRWTDAARAAMGNGCAAYPEGLSSGYDA